MLACLCGGVLEVGILVAIVTFVAGLFTHGVNCKRAAKCPRPCCKMSTPHNRESYRIDDAQTPRPRRRQWRDRK